MDISKKDLDEFKRIFKKDYGEELSDEEAYRIACKLITLFNAIYRPIPQDQKKK